jgi:redox-sensitive bicupin YhaK (pirin superfamily)
MLELRRSGDRGVGKQPWLDARFTFSFGPYQDPEQMGFSDLCLLNDDRVAPGGGFPTHEHRDMEVFSYVLSGALEHKDSMGHGSVVPAGDVLVMSAATGITHSEFNHSSSEPVHFLQIWMLPDRKAVAPRYGQKHFEESRKRGRLCLLLSSDGRDGSMRLYQDARVYAGLFDGDERADLALGPNRYAYAHVIRGKVTLNGVALSDGDGVRIRSELALAFSDGQDAEVLLFDLRPREVQRA